MSYLLAIFVAVYSGPENIFFFFPNKPFIFRIHSVIISLNSAITWTVDKSSPRNGYQKKRSGARTFGIGTKTSLFFPGLLLHAL